MTGLTFSLNKIASDLNSNKVNTITIEAFSRLCKVLDKKGRYPVADK